MDTKYIIALEIGSSAIKAAAAKIAASSRDTLSLLAIEEQPISAIVPRGRIQNVEEVTHHVKEVLDKLASTPEVYPRQIVGVRVGVGGRSLATAKTSIKLKLPNECEITENIIKRLYDEAAMRIPEGREVLDIIPTRFTVDDQATPRPKGSFGNSISADFTLVYCDSVNVKNLKRVINERLGLNIEYLVVRPLAIANLVLTGDDTMPGCMLADIGAETTTVSIFKNGHLQYISTIPIGSKHITSDLAQGLGIVEERAEQTKISFGTAVNDLTKNDPEQARIDNIVMARVTEIVANIFAHIEFAGYKPKDLSAGIIITGRGTKLRNFGLRLESYSGMKVRSAHVPHVIRVTDSSINTIDNIDLISVAYDNAALDLDDPQVRYVTEPKPEPKPEPVEQPIVIDPKGYESVVGVPEGGFNIAEYQEPGKNRVDDGSELLDDDLAEQKRNREAEKRRKDAEIEKKIREKEAERERERNQTKKKFSSFFSRMKEKAVGFISENDESDNMDE